MSAQRTGARVGAAAVAGWRRALRRAGLGKERVGLTAQPRPGCGAHGSDLMGRQGRGGCDGTSRCGPEIEVWASGVG